MKIFDRTYSPVAYQIGSIYESHRIMKRKKIPKHLRWLYDGKVWVWYAVRVSDRT